MRSNFTQIYNDIFDELAESNDIDIDIVLNRIMPRIRFSEHPSRAKMAREIIRNRLTTALNSDGIYSFKKGHFVNIENANEEQLTTFIKKAIRDIDAAERRKAKAELLKSQIEMAWDEEGHFIGFIVPEAMTV